MSIPPLSRALARVILETREPNRTQQLQCSVDFALGETQNKNKTGKRRAWGGGGGGGGGGVKFHRLGKKK